MMKKVHHIVRAGFSLLVALTIALPGVGFSVASNQAWAESRAVNDPPPTTLAEAKANLDTAKTLESGAATEEAKAKAALDAAKATHQTATNDHAANASAVEQATNQANAKIAEIVANVQDEYDKAAADVKVYGEAYDAAQAKKAAAEASRDQAEADYNAAQAEYDAKVAAITNAGNAELQAAYTKLREAENAYEQATTTYKDAANEYKAADSERKDMIASYNAAKTKVAECEAAVSAAQAKVAAAQKALDDAKAGLGTAAEDDQKAALQAAVNEAQAKLDSAKGEKTAAQNRLTAAQSEQSAAQQAVADAEAAVEAAKANMGDVDIDALQAAVNEAQKKYDDAKAAYESGAKNAGVEKPYQQALNEKIAAENAYKEADELVTSTLQKLNAAKEELAAITAGGGGNQQKVLSVKEFFDEQGSSAASTLFDTMGEAGYTQSGSPGDATDVEFISKALDLIENLNSIRASEGLPDLRVTDELMAYEVISLNFVTSAQFIPLLSSYNELFASSGDNANWGMNGLYNLFMQQKQVWDDALTTNMCGQIELPEGWSQMKPEQLEAACSEFFLEVYAYVNIVAPTNIYVGSAANHMPGMDYAYAFCFREVVDGPYYTLAQWKTRFELWVDQKQGATIATAATDEEIAAAQKKVDDAQKDYEDAVTDRGTKESVRDAAVAQLQAAESVKGLEDAFTQADNELADAKQAHDTAVASVGDLDDPNHPLNVAVTNAKSDLATKTESVTSIQNEISALDTKISQLTTARDDAQTALENYSAVDTSAQEAALAAAKRELDRANIDLENARATMNALAPRVAELNSKCQDLVQKQTNIRTTLLTPTKTASDNAKRDYDNLLKTTQENSDYREMLKLKNALDNARKDFTDTLYTIADQQVAMTNASRQQNEARAKLSVADTKLAAAKQLTLEGVMANPLGSGDFDEFLVLNDHAQNVKDVQTIAKPTGDRVNAAKADLDAAQAAYDAACAKYAGATADRVEAQRIYDSFLGLNNDTNKPGTSTTPGSSGSNGSSDPVVEPGNSSKPGGASSSSDPVVEPWNSSKPGGASSSNANKGATGDKGANAGGRYDAQGDGAETESGVGDEAIAEEATGYNAAQGHVAMPKAVSAQPGLNPLAIVGIAAALVLAAGIVILLIVRHRRTAAAAAATGVDATSARAASSASANPPKDGSPVE